MAAIVIYRCPRCRFQAQLMAGGYQATYRPKVCGQCAQLVSVLEDLNPKLRKLADPGTLAMVGRCPLCHSTNLRPWDDEAARCPRCTTPMEISDGPSWDDTLRPTRR
jgi:hypothetical protein